MNPDIIGTIYVAGAFITFLLAAYFLPKEGPESEAPMAMAVALVSLGWPIMLPMILLATLVVLIWRWLRG
jgi:hypothetical protein